MFGNRLQVLTPLSLLINIATFAVATFVVSPGLSTISKLHPTPISPSPSLVGIYVIAIFAGQIGYCVLLVLASKEETKVCYPKRLCSDFASQRFFPASAH